MFMWIYDESIQSRVGIFHVIEIMADMIEARKSFEDFCNEHDFIYQDNKGEWHYDSN